MRGSWSYRIWWVVLLLWLPEISHAQRQLVFGKSVVEIGYAFVSVNGPETIHLGNYTSPAFFSNFKSSFSVEARVSRKVWKYVHGQLSANFVSFYSWRSQESNRYSDARHTLLEISPMLMVSSGFRERGVWNRLSLFASFGPTISYQSTSLPGPLYFATGNGEDFTTSTQLAAGIAAGGGVRLALTSRVSVAVQGSIHNFFMSSYLFDETQFSYWSIGTSLGYRMGLNKRVKYSAQ